MGLLNNLWNSAVNVGSGIGNIALNSAKIQQQYNTSEREAAQAYQTEMSNTAIQRQMADLKASGLNPYAMFSSGQVVGASVPNSAGSSGSNPNGIQALNSAANILFKAVNIGRNMTNDSFKNVTSIAKLIG